MSNTPLRLFLVRHGNTFEKGEIPTQVGAKTDIPLTSQGREQARLFAECLISQSIRPKAIYAGGLKRQIESAHIVASSLSLPSEAIHLNEKGLTEIDYGKWEGLTSEAITAEWPQEYEAWSHRAEWPPNVFVGSLEGHLQALRQWLDHLRASYTGGETVVGFTSNGIMRFFYALQDPTHWEQLKKQSQIEDLKVKTGHFGEIWLYPHSIKIEKWNQNPRNFL